MKSVKVKNARIDCGCGCNCCKTNKNESIGISNRRVCVSASPAFPVEIANDKGSRKDDLVCDSGCTAECIVNKDFADSLGLTIHPTNIRSATLGDGETDMTILGEIDIDTSFMGNPINIKAVVTEEAEGILLGMPGMEN